MEGTDVTLDIADELTISTVKKRAVKSIVILTGRTFILQLVALGSQVVLTILLRPDEFGVFFLVSSVISFFSYFSDIGLAAALVQKKDKLNDDELSTVFLAQQLLVILIFVIIIISTPLIVSWYHLAPESVYLIWALGVGLILSSLKTIPSVLLERRLDFAKLIVPQLAETFVYNISVVYLAWRGFGISSFTISVLLQGIVGLIILYYLQPWFPKLIFSRSYLKSLLNFGVPYQLNTLLALAKDNGIMVVLGGILGTYNIGLLGWAQKWSAAPLRFFMDQVIRVTFPAYSRLQHDRENLSLLVSKTIFFICLLIFPSLVLLVTLAPNLTVIIPKYQKWQPALLALTLLSINAAWAAISTPLTNLFNAIGKISTTFKLMIMWTVLTWVLIPFLSYKYGLTGAALAFALVGTSSIITILISLKYINLDIIQGVIKPLLAAVIMGIGIFFIKQQLPVNLYGTLATAGIGIMIYLVVILGLVGLSLISDLRKLIELVKQRNP